MGLHLYPHWGLWFSYSVQSCKYLLRVLTQHSCTHNAHTNSLTRSFPRCYQNDITCTPDLVIHLLKTIQQLSVAHTGRVWILYPKRKPKQVKIFFLPAFPASFIKSFALPRAIQHPPTPFMGQSVWTMAWWCPVPSSCFCFFPSCPEGFPAQNTCPNSLPCSSGQLMHCFNQESLVWNLSELNLFHLLDYLPDSIWSLCMFIPKSWEDNMV